MPEPRETMMKVTAIATNTPAIAALQDRRDCARVGGIWTTSISSPMTDAESDMTAGIIGLGCAEELGQTSAAPIHWALVNEFLLLSVPVGRPGEGLDRCKTAARRAVTAQDRNRSADPTLAQSVAAQPDSAPCGFPNLNTGRTETNGSVLKRHQKH